MKKVMINATGLTLMLMLCISFHLHAQTDTLDKQFTQLKSAIRNQLNEKDDQIHRLQQENAALKHALDSLQINHAVPAAKNSSQLKKAFGTDFMQTVSQSTNITAYLLSPKEQEKDKMESPGYYLGYQILDSAKAAPEVRPIILNESTYDFNALQKMCAFNPSVAYKFTAKGKTAIILVSFDCNEFVFYQDSKRLGKYSAANVREALLKISRSIFGGAKSLEDLR